MSGLTMEEQPAGGYRICLKIDGVEACCYADSMHVAYGKEKFLRVAIERQVAAAIEDS